MDDTINSKLVRIIIWLVVAVISLIFIAQHICTDKYCITFLDNIHWTIGNAAAAAMAWLGYSRSTNISERTARRWFFIGTSAYLIGQIFWDVQVIIGWNPFPAPSDIGYLLLGPCCLIGLIMSMTTMLAKHNYFVMAVDASMLTISVLALTLAIYIPISAGSSTLTLIVMTLYPVALLTATCFGILMVLHLRPKINWTWLVFQFGLGLQGLIWLWWNTQALSGTTVEGSFLNQLFSVASIIVGVSAMQWHMTPSNSERYAKWCEGVLRMFPIGAIIIAAIASVWVLASNNILPLIQDIVISSAFVVIILATVRQGYMLKEYEQLLEIEKAIVESQNFLQIVVNTAPIRVFWKDADLRFIGCNEAFARDAGMDSVEDVIGKDDYSMIWKDYADAYRKDDFAVINSGFPKLSYVEPLILADGDTIWISTSKVPLRNIKNEIIGILGVFSDVTASRRAEQQLRIAASAFETHDAIMITDADANIIRVNHAFERIAGYKEEEVIGKTPRILSSGRHGKAFYSEMWRVLLDKGTWTGEIWDRHKTGTIYPKQATISTVKNEQGETTNYVSIFSDISERKNAENEIKLLAHTDSLTGLYNRRYTTDRLNLALTASAHSNEYGALLFLDLDDFKIINDTAGHWFGDKLLVEVSNRLKLCVESEAIISRIGGDEFTVILENVGINEEEASKNVAQVAEKICEILATPYQIEGKNYHSTTSIGVSLFCGTNASVDGLFKCADMAMYKAKDSGRNRIQFFDPYLQLAIETKARLETDLRDAVSSQQLQLYYQIQLDHERRPIGAEVLVRWLHPQRGFVAPALFIPVAEQSTLILDIGNWVLDTACCQISRWSNSQKMRDIVLAVNISAEQFRQHDFVDIVQNMLKKYDVEPSRLKLELTESVALVDIETMIVKMGILKSVVGVTLSLDDFGTGFSSLSYLKRLPLNQVKIDRSFVRDITTDNSDAVMVKAIIDMAKSFELDVIAEGVETEAQLAFLLENGCKAFQGYLFSQPVPIEKFEELLEQDSPHHIDPK
jgi:diguanylate cyclase (GGDEF)-like protein/PAS domain S-box-containing protein